MTQWQLQDAKNRFSEVVARALKDGPQLVTRRGKDPVVVLALDEYRRLQRPATDLVTFFRNSPLAEVELETERDADMPRDVDL